jgi:uncharacterized protein (TIGR02145 family)
MRNVKVLNLMAIITSAMLIIACEKDDIFSSKVNRPTVSTTDILDITMDSAMSGGEITDDGGSEVTARGVVWSTSEHPMTHDSKTTDGSGSGTFTSVLTGLQPDKIYYVRAYATNSSGTGYGNQVSFTTAGWDHETGIVSDIDGNEYQTVKIGDQWWMAENLKVSRYRNDDNISNIISISEWRNLTTGAWVYYGNSSSAERTYGKLYNWYAVDDSRGLCPEGWRVPSDEEWKELEMHLGMTQEEADRISPADRGTDEGDKLKSTSPLWDSDWGVPYVNATNESGFSALPGGRREHTGNFVNVGRFGSWWSSTEFSDNDVWYRSLFINHSMVDRSYYSKNTGYSVRCIRDE